MNICKLMFKRNYSKAYNIACERLQAEPASSLATYSRRRKFCNPIPCPIRIKTVACAVSGGVDSCTSALLLKRKGYDVLGIFMKNWDLINEKEQCTVDQDYYDAQYVCTHIGIPFYEVNFVKQYWNEVFCNTLEEYKKGLTPNPDILCNKSIKFGIFYKEVMEHFGVDAIATGHYAQNSFGEDLENYSYDKGASLLTAVDEVKDQTFFLSQIPQNALQKCMFPVGKLTKDVVQNIACEAGLKKIAKRKSSTGICFIGKRNFQRFISDYVESKPGNFIDIETGSIVGRHSGIHNWTIGQRCCLQGKKIAYVIAKKMPPSQDILVAPGVCHPSLYSESALVESPYWINRAPHKLIQDNQLECKMRFQQGFPLVNCNLFVVDDNYLLVKIEKPLRALTPGQFIAFYLDNECLGSAKIVQPGPSLYDLNLQSQESSYISEEFFTHVLCK